MASAVDTAVPRTRASTMPPTRLATTGLRRHHRQARSAPPTRRADRLAGLKPAQVLGQVCRRRGTAWPGSFARHFRAMVSRSRGRPGTSREGGTGSAALTCSRVSRARRAAEWRPAGQELVEDRPHRVDVGRGAGLPGLAQRPARAPCSWASPGSTRCGSAPTRSPATWPGRSR